MSRLNTKWLFINDELQEPVLSYLGFVTMTQQGSGMRLGKTNGDMMPPGIISANNDKL